MLRYKSNIKNFSVFRNNGQSISILCIIALEGIAADELYFVPFLRPWAACHKLAVVLILLNNTLSSLFQLSIGHTGLQERACFWDTVSWRETGSCSCGGQCLRHAIICTSKQQFRSTEGILLTVTRARELRIQLYLIHMLVMWTGLYTQFTM